MREAPNMTGLTFYDAERIAEWFAEQRKKAEEERQEFLKIFIFNREQNRFECQKCGGRIYQPEDATKHLICYKPNL